MAEVPAGAVPGVCANCSEPLTYFERRLTACLKCEPLTDYEPFPLAQCGKTPPRPLIQQMCLLTREHTGPHQVYDGFVWPSAHGSSPQPHQTPEAGEQRG